MTRFTISGVLDTYAKWFAHRFGWTGQYLPLFHLLLAGLVVLSASRLGLVIWQWERVSAAGIVVSTFVQGIRADLILLGYLLVIPLSFAPLSAFRRLEKWWHLGVAWWASFALIFIVFMELATGA